jgi:hypothetical protein
VTGPFIKVTKTDWPDHDYYVNMSLVARMWQEDYGGAGLLVGGEALFVSESVQELLQRFLAEPPARTPSRGTRRRPALEPPTDVTGT